MTWNAFAPRLGVTYDMSGDGKTVFKGHYGRYFINIADDLSAANPASYAFVRYKFLDPNQNGVYDGPGELGELVSQRGTVGSTIEDVSGTPVNPDLPKSYADEFSLSVEREMAADTGLRFSYVRKQLRNDFGQYNKGQVLPLLERSCSLRRFGLPLPGRSVWQYDPHGSGAGRRRRCAGSRNRHVPEWFRPRQLRHDPVRVRPEVL